jgi:hypothetical protein
VIKIILFLLSDKYDKRMMMAGELVNSRKEDTVIAKEAKFFIF